MIMDDASSRQSAQRRTATQRLPIQAFGGLSLRSTYLKSRGPNQRMTIRGTSGSLQVQSNELRRAKVMLQRLYTQEKQALHLQAVGACSNLREIRSSRGTAERRYVNCLIRFLRDTNRMSSGQATQLQQAFTRDKMAGMGMSNQKYLLGMYPRELT